MTAKEQIQVLLKNLPDDCTLEDIQYHLYVLEKIKQGRDSAILDGTIPHADAVERLSKWLRE